MKFVSFFAGIGGIDLGLERAYAERLRATRRGKFYRADLAKIERWLTKKMRRHNDVYLTAEQAVKIGFADEVFDGKWDQLTTK